MDEKNKTFYIPISKLEIMLYKVRGKTSIQAQEIFNDLQNSKDSKIFGKISRHITIQETYANDAFASDEVPAFTYIVNRQIDHFTYEDEDLELPSNNLTIVY